MQRICKGIALVASLWLAGLSVVWAAQDPLTGMALESYRETVATYRAPANEQGVGKALEQQAQYVMLVKNGMSLYREGVLTSDDKATLAAVVDQQVSIASAALAGSVSIDHRSLADHMHRAGLAAQQLLEMEPAAPNFAGLMENYHNGIGYSAYRRAQAAGIEQSWQDAN